MKILSVRLMRNILSYTDSKSVKECLATAIDMCAETILTTFITSVFLVVQY